MPPLVPLRELRVPGPLLLDPFSLRLVVAQRTVINNVYHPPPDSTLAWPILVIVSMFITCKESTRVIMYVTKILRASYVPVLLC